MCTFFSVSKKLVFLQSLMSAGSWEVFGEKKIIMMQNFQVHFFIHHSQQLTNKKYSSNRKLEALMFEVFAQVLL